MPCFLLLHFRKQICCDWYEISLSSMFSETDCVLFIHFVSKKAWLSGNRQPRFLDTTPVPVLALFTHFSWCRGQKVFCPQLIPTKNFVSNCSAASCSRNSANIRNPLICYTNHYFLMFSGSQVQKPYHASMNGFLTFWPWHHFMHFAKSYLRTNLLNSLIVK